MINKAVKKGLWLTGGILFLLLAIVGLMLPVVPQLIFFIISIICFMEFSERFQRWVHKQHWFERIQKHLPRHLHHRKN
jgi:uncharacterized protein